MRRSLLIGAIFLLAGAVVNVAVAWACAVWSHPQEPARWAQISPAPQEHYFLELVETHKTGLFDSGALVEHACSGRGVQIDFVYTRGIEYNLDLRITSGWPSLAMESRSLNRLGIGVPRYPLTRARGDGTMDAFERAYLTATIRARQQATSTPRQIVATGPIWSGFAVNTLVFATVLCLLACGPFAFRRLLRARRGRCPKCAYPTSDSDVCTECGKPLPKRAKATT